MARLPPQSLPNDCNTLVHHGSFLDYELEGRLILHRSAAEHPAGGFTLTAPPASSVQHPARAQRQGLGWVIQRRGGARRIAVESSEPTPSDPICEAPVAGLSRGRLAESQSPEARRAWLRSISL